MKNNSLIGENSLLFLGGASMFVFGGFVPLQIAGLLGSIYSGISIIEEIRNSKWKRVFLNCGIKNDADKVTPRLIKKETTLLGERYLFSLPMGLTIKKFEEKEEELETVMKKPIRLRLTKNYNVILQIFDVFYKSFYRPSYEPRIDGKMIFPIGIELTENGEKVVYIDIDGSQPHILVGGITGSGKTSFIKCLLTAMCLQNIELKIIDMKMGGDYNVFKHYKYLTDFVKEVDDAEDVLEKIRVEKNKRTKLLSDNDCKDYKDYNKKFPKNPMKPLVVLFEEYTMLSNNKNFTNELNILLSQTRAVNIKFILSIQRPCHENLNPKLKANLNHTVAFRAKTTFNSEILLDRGDFRAVNDLRECGEAILLNDNQDIEFKSFYLDDGEIARIILPKCNPHHYNGGTCTKSKITNLDDYKKEPKELEVSLI